MIRNIAERLSFQHFFNTNRATYFPSAFAYSRLTHAAGLCLFLAFSSLFTRDSIHPVIDTPVILGFMAYLGLTFLIHRKMLYTAHKAISLKKPSRTQFEKAGRDLIEFPRQLFIIEFVLFSVCTVLPSMIWGSSNELTNDIFIAVIFTIALDYLVMERYVTPPLMALRHEGFPIDLSQTLSIKHKILMVCLLATAVLAVNAWSKAEFHHERLQILIIQKPAKLPLLTDHEIRRFSGDLLLSTLGICAAFSLIVWLMVYRFTGALSRLEKTLGAVHQGQFGEVTVSLTPDETGLLNNRLDDVVQMIQDKINQLQTHSSEMHAASNLMADISSEQNQSLVRQSASVTQTSSTLNELLESSKQISESASSVVNFAEDTEKHATNGLTNMNNTVQLMSAVREQNHVSVSDIIQLSEAIQEIEQVLNLIISIADETNLIALNAAIEASSAGEYGKRFKVVANEVRGLSDRVTKSIHSIKMLTETIQDATSRLVVASQENSEKVEDTYQSAQMTYQYFREISEWAKKSADAAKQIYIAIQQQRMANQQISVSFTDISNDIVELAAASERYKQYAGTLKKFSSSMESVMAYFNIQSNDNGLLK
ncbi:methyl-accepting chemotaxis protein [bacterium]|nr:methyl-accepting chemotaxis protein [bacterium]